MRDRTFCHCEIRRSHDHQDSRYNFVVSGESKFIDDVVLTDMALRDHFRPPLSTRRHWHSFHNAWSTYIADDLNQSLPEGYFAEPNAQFGIEIDVAAFSERIPVNPLHQISEILEPTFRTLNCHIGSGPNPRSEMPGK